MSPRSLGRPPLNHETVTSTLRMPRETFDRIDAEAERRVLGRSKLIELVMLRFLDECDAAAADGSPPEQGTTP